MVTQDTRCCTLDPRQYTLRRPEASDAESSRRRSSPMRTSSSAISRPGGPAGYDAMWASARQAVGRQRQRIAIARVILKNAPILVLDEATRRSTEVEAAIQASLDTLMADKT